MTPPMRGALPTLTVLVADGRGRSRRPPTAALFADPPPALRAYLGLTWTAAK